MTPKQKHKCNELCACMPPIEEFTKVTNSNNKKTEELTNRFLKVYSNLPLGIRTDIIAVIDKQPMTWNVCWLEIDQETEMADRILKYLDDMDFI